MAENIGRNESGISTLEKLLRSGKAIRAGRKLFFKPEVTGEEALQAIRELEQQSPSSTAPQKPSRPQIPFVP